MILSAAGEFDTREMAEPPSVDQLLGLISIGDLNAQLQAIQEQTVFLPS